MRTSILIFVSMIVLMFVATGCYDVEYTAELNKDGNCIKFEDAMSYDAELEEMVEDCLGEDGAVEADLFIVVVEGDVAAIDVTVKAGKCKTDGSIDPLAPVALDLCGFTIVLEDVYEGEYWFSVTSDDIEGGNKEDGTAALSNITFCFGEGVTVKYPEEGTVTVERDDYSD